MSAELWPDATPPELDHVFERDRALAATRWESGAAAPGPIATFSLLELAGYAVWDARKGFWSPAPEKAATLRRDADLLLSGNDPDYGSGFPYLEDVRGVVGCWPFWTPTAELAPGVCPILSPEQRESALAVIERARRCRAQHAVQGEEQ